MDGNGRWPDAEPWGARVRRLRAERGWSQRTLAERAGVDQSLISKLETGYQDGVLLSTVVKIADALGTSMDGLMGRRAPTEAPAGRRAASDARIRDLTLQLLRIVTDEGSEGEPGLNSGSTKLGAMRLDIAPEMVAAG